MMIMSAADSTFFTLNEVATAIWQAADGITPVSRIIREKICRDFDVDHDQAQADANHFIERLSSHGILVVSDQPIANSAKLPETQ